MKFKKTLIALFLTFLIIQSGCTSERNTIVEENTDIETIVEEHTDIEMIESENDNNLPKEQVSIYLEDALDLINVLESTHPAFSLGDISENYEQEKQNFINSINENTSETDFILLAKKFLTVLQDGHTGIQKHSNMQFLNLNCHAVENELFLINKDGSLSETSVIKIRGKAIEEIFKTVQEYYVAENESAKVLNNSIWALNQEVLKLAGCEITDNSTNVTMNENGAISNKQVNFVYINIYENYKYRNEIESKMIDDIFYIDMNICNDNRELDENITKLTEAIKNGVTKIIIDVRDNPGGNSMACTKLLNAMGMSVPNYGTYIRFSELAHDKYDMYPSEGFEQHDPDKTTAKRNENIELVVLTNEWTYSSATILATLVKDGNLGTLIGTPSSNSPSCYGDILKYRMPNSRIEASISFKRFLRPDTETDQRILMPDIVTQHNDDILKVAIDYLNTK